MSNNGKPKLAIVMVMYSGVDPLNLVGPYEVLSRLPAARIQLVSGTPAPIRCSLGLTLAPDACYSNTLKADVLFVPGGPGHRAMLEDIAFLTYLQKQAEVAALVSSVCTGSLLLGAAGLLHGYAATTHWVCMEDLTLYGAIPVPKRIVIDRDRITGAGVSA
ncbi:MAG: DJ-1/PfpI family protein, partial [Candidatus Eremiobacteraeota bacterium]|nr:DJ-1/PfpI family protein [Candidatus Eremiobacteraeota bacterium]